MRRNNLIGVPEGEFLPVASKIDMNRPKLPSSCDSICDPNARIRVEYGNPLKNTKLQLHFIGRFTQAIPKPLAIVA